MRKLGLLLLTPLFFGGLLMMESAFGGGQDKPAVVADDDPTPLPTFEDSGELPEELQDSAFDRYVDLRQLGEAVNASDASLAADVALQLAEGERILLRPHKAMSAKNALTLALKLAAEQRDKGTLQRLGEYAKRSNDASLSQQLGQAQALAGAKRAIDPVFQASAETMTVEQFAYLQWIGRELETAKLIGNGSRLKELIEEIKTAGPDLLDGGRKPAVLKRVEAAAAQAGKTAPGAEATQLADVVAKLQDAARAAAPPLPGTPAYNAYMYQLAAKMKGRQPQYTTVTSYSVIYSVPSPGPSYVKSNSLAQTIKRELMAYGVQANLTPVGNRDSRITLQPMPVTTRWYTNIRDRTRAYNVLATHQVTVRTTEKTEKLLLRPLK